MTLNKETFQGTVNTLKDAVLLIEGVRLGLLPSITKRLNEYERELIKPNLIYVWNETECGLKRWTDGKIWSASKALGPFLIYTELEKKADTKPKFNGLVKQSFSLSTKQNQRFHLIAYLSSDELANAAAPQIPSSDSSLANLYLSPSIYQENILSYVYNGSSTPMQQPSQFVNQPLPSQPHPSHSQTLQQPHPQQERQQERPHPHPLPHQEHSHPHPHQELPHQHAHSHSHSHSQVHPHAHALVNPIPDHVHAPAGPTLGTPHPHNPQLVQHQQQLSHQLHHQHVVAIAKPTLHEVIDTPPRRRYNDDDEKILLTLNRHFDKPK